MNASRAEERGRRADRPSDIPSPGWRDILVRAWRESAADNVSMVAAGVAYYALFAIFPALAALVSIYGLVADPAQVDQQVQSLSGFLPQDVLGIIHEQLQKVSSQQQGALSIGAIGGLLIALYSASKGMKALMEALNITYDEDEKRGFIKLNLIALLLTLGLIVFVIVALALIVAIPALFGSLGLPPAIEWTVSLVRWPLLAAAAVAVLAILYRYAPSRDEPKWRWVSLGAVAAMVLWIVGSILFSWYISNFGNYGATYGSVTAVIVLMLWFWLSAYIVLMGAEVNAEMEHQTERDTTEGSHEPRGRRGAYVADTVGEQP